MDRRPTSKTTYPVAITLFPTESRLKCRFYIILDFITLEYGTRKMLLKCRGVNTENTLHTNLRLNNKMFHFLYTVFHILVNKKCFITFKTSTLKNTFACQRFSRNLILILYQEAYSILIFVLICWLLFYQSYY